MYFLNRLLAHIAIGFVFGYLYKDVGMSANTILANYVYMYGSLLLIVYTGKMSVTLSCKYYFFNWIYLMMISNQYFSNIITVPLEMKILTREHFNRWYKLTPYLLSVLLLEVPFQVSIIIPTT